MSASVCVFGLRCGQMMTGRGDLPHHDFGQLLGVPSVPVSVCPNHLRRVHALIAWMVGNRRVDGLPGWVHDQYLMAEISTARTAVTAWLASDPQTMPTFDVPTARPL